MENKLIIAAVLGIISENGQRKFILSYSLALISFRITSQLQWDEEHITQTNEVKQNVPRVC